MFIWAFFKNPDEGKNVIGVPFLIKVFAAPKVCENFSAEIFRRKKTTINLAGGAEPPQTPPRQAGGAAPPQTPLLKLQFWAEKFSAEFFSAEHFSSEKFPTENFSAKKIPAEIFNLSRGVGGGKAPPA